MKTNKFRVGCFLAALTTLLTMSVLIIVSDAGGIPAVTTQECNECLEDGWTVCKTRFNNSVSVCCNPDREASENCTSLEQPHAMNYEFCSTEAFIPSLRPFACPYASKACWNSLCDENECYKDKNKAILDPFTRNYTVVSAGGNQFRNGEACYYQFVADQSKIVLPDPWDTTKPPPLYDYQIDCNITEMRGVLATIHNGTIMYAAGNETEVNFEAGQRNFTFNATGFNNVWLHFTADPSYKGQPLFTALVGLRPTNKTDEFKEYDKKVDEEEERKIEIPEPKVIIPPTRSYLTANEQIIIYCVLFSIVIFCCKKSYCPNSWTIKTPTEEEFKQKIEMQRVENLPSDSDEDFDKDTKQASDGFQGGTFSKMNDMKADMGIINGISTTSLGKQRKLRQDLNNMGQYDTAQGLFSDTAKVPNQVFDRSRDKPINVSPSGTHRNTNLNFGEGSLDSVAGDQSEVVKRAQDLEEKLNEKKRKLRELKEKNEQIKKDLETQKQLEKEKEIEQDAQPPAKLIKTDQQTPQPDANADEIPPEADL